MRRVYVAGPMSGYPGYNFPAFNSAAEYLREQGYSVVNPVDVNPDTTTPWADCLKQDIARLIGCDEVALLPGWEASRGARLEVHIAQALGMPTKPFHVYQLEPA